jgi:hypothetical protein
MTAVEQHVVTLLALGQYLVHIVDAKALAVSKVSEDPDLGYGRGTGAYQKGYKLYCIWSGGPMPQAWGLAPNATHFGVLACQRPFWHGICALT